MFEELLSSNAFSMERLHTLVKLKDAGSLIGAAKGNFARQARFSHHLRELSSFFGVALTVRSGRSIKLTAAGESLVQIAKDQFQIFSTFRERSLGQTNQITIAASDSLAQWLLVPAIGQIRRGRKRLNLCLKNLRTREIRSAIIAKDVEFGLLRLEGVEKPLKHTIICEQKYAIFVPKRLISSRGVLKVSDALLHIPHAALGLDGKLIEQLKLLGAELDGSYRPDLTCESINQCVAAVQSGAFASVLPTLAWPASPGLEYEVVGEGELAHLSRKIVLAWLPRTMDIGGKSLDQFRQEMIKSLKEAATARVQF